MGRKHCGKRLVLQTSKNQGLFGKGLSIVNPLTLSKLKAFADNKLNVAQNITLVFHKEENIAGKRRKCWLLALSPFPIMFSKGLFPGASKSSMYIKELYSLTVLYQICSIRVPGVEEDCSLGGNLLYFENYR